jgi:hypothetical protein
MAERDIFKSYDYKIERLVGWYKKLNAVISYPDGMTTSLGIVYWGREGIYAELEKAVPRLKAEGLGTFSRLLEAVATPGRMQKASERTGVSPGLLKVLKHDLGLWLPKAVPLEQIDSLQVHARYFKPLAAAGIQNQLQLLSSARTPPERKALARQTGIPIRTLAEMVKWCDLHRLGSNLKYIRTRIYHDMGWDTWQKWADSKAEEIMRHFAGYTRRKGLDAARLTPGPKEVRNGIEWAKLHLKLFAVEW